MGNGSVLPLGDGVHRGRLVFSNLSGRAFVAVPEKEVVFRME